MDVVNFQKSLNENIEVSVEIEMEDVGFNCITDVEATKIIEEAASLLGSNRNKCVAFVDEEECLEDEEKQDWKKIFSKLDEVDTAKSGVVSIKALLKIINRLEDKNSNFHIGPQTEKKIQRFD